MLERLGVAVTSRVGRRLWARCPHPDHDDKDPSWYVWNAPGEDRHGHHHCFGCGWGGGLVRLVQAVLGYDDEDDAWDWLRSEDVAITATGAVFEVRGVESMRIGLPVPPGVRVVPLRDWPTPAARYARSRGLTDEIVDRWGLGYGASDDVAYRIWIPIRDERGRLVCWQARTYIDDSLRYTTPAGVRPGAIVGQVFWPPRDARGLVVVVEGPLDAIAVDRATRLPVAALMGSQPVPRQLVALSSFRRVLVLTDSDPAGDAAGAVLVGALARWTSVERVRLPDGYDPADAGDVEVRRALGVG